MVLLLDLTFNQIDGEREREKERERRNNCLISAAAPPQKEE
jgi:hypothetical protein